MHALVGEPDRLLLLLLFVRCIRILWLVSSWPLSQKLERDGDGDYGGQRRLQLVLADMALNSSQLSRSPNGLVGVLFTRVDALVKSTVMSGSS